MKRSIYSLITTAVFTTQLINTAAHEQFAAESNSSTSSIAAYASLASYLTVDQANNSMASTNGLDDHMFLQNPAASSSSPDWEAEFLPQEAAHNDLPQAQIDNLKVKLDLMAHYLSIDAISNLTEEELNAHTMDDRLLLLQIVGRSIKESHDEFHKGNDDQWKNTNTQRLLQFIGAAAGASLPWIADYFYQRYLTNILGKNLSNVLGEAKFYVKRFEYKQSSSSSWSYINCPAIPLRSSPHVLGLSSALGAYCGSSLAKALYKKAIPSMHQRSIDRKIEILRRLLSHEGPHLLEVPSLLDTPSTVCPQEKAVVYLDSVRNILTPIKEHYPLLRALLDSKK